VVEYLLICAVAFVTSGLTLLSGFGLGTLLLPAFAVFFPVDLAVAMTAIVHFLNNLFKLGLVGKYAERSVIVAFGLPALFAALVGAWVLVRVSDLPPLAQYQLLGHEFSILPVKVVIGLLMVVFAVLEGLPGWQQVSFPKQYLPLGGILSGFFGGISGHQGALRSAFLVRGGLTKESYLGTSVVIACLVDISRISIYSTHFSSLKIHENDALLSAAVLSAFIGALVGNRLIKKITFRFIQILISVLLFLIGFGLAMGMI
jgi:uncharacterized membrane protein YfcA